jgi:hypothetical protein
MVHLRKCILKMKYFWNKVKSNVRTVLRTSLLLYWISKKVKALGYEFKIGFSCIKWILIWFHLNFEGQSNSREM